MAKGRTFINHKIQILSVLPNDSTRIADENSLLITDIVVKLENGSLANVEVQKIGYGFPGQRSACYSADLLLRQYKRVRSEKNKNIQKFSYKDIKDVFTIVLYEQSPGEFKKHPDTYLHYFEQKSDTGINLPLLQTTLTISYVSSKNIRSFGQCMNRHIRFAGMLRMLWDYFQKN